MRLKLQTNTFFPMHPQRQVIQHLLDSKQRSSGFAVSQLQIAMQPLIFYNLTSKEAVTLNPIPHPPAPLPCSKPTRAPIHQAHAIHPSSPIPNPKLAFPVHCLRSLQKHRSHPLSSILAGHRSPNQPLPHSPQLRPKHTILRTLHKP